ncbi:MAG: DUF503 domain-containing protein [Oscillospiraceae bacterium]
MYVFYGHAELFLPHSLSLKEKRKTIQSIIARIRKRFNISIAEVNYQDLWQRSSLGFAAVCNTYTDAELMVSVIKDTLDLYEDDCDVVDFFNEINQIQLFR